jgi:hypothetical protein
MLSNHDIIKFVRACTTGLYDASVTTDGPRVASGVTPPSRSQRRSRRTVEHVISHRRGAPDPVWFLRLLLPPPKAHPPAPPPAYRATAQRRRERTPEKR